MLPISDSRVHPVPTRLPQASLCLGFLANTIPAKLLKAVLLTVNHHLLSLVQEPQTSDKQNTGSFS